jgi:hypothetical protein
MVKCGVLFEIRTEFLNNIYNLDELRLQRVKASYTLEINILSSRGYRDILTTSG